MCDRCDTDGMVESLLDALATANGARPVAISADRLVDCLEAGQPDMAWRGHVAALFGGKSAAVLHNMVRHHLTSFDVLERALTVWNLQDAPQADWVRRMATRERGDRKSVHA